IDPHYSYSTLSSTVALAIYEPLIRLKGDSTDEFEGMMAESWEVSDDQTTFTFHLYPDMLFHDGTPANAQAVKDSYTRWIEMGGSPVGVITRFVESPDMMEVVDDLTLRFNLGTPQPLFLSAMASSYGPMVISPTALAENATEDDPYAHEWAKEFGIGSGAYVLESNNLSEGIVFKKFENYHRGWEGNHFDQIIMRVVPEDGARRQLLERGEADAAPYNLTFEAVDTMRSDPNLNVVEYPSTAVSWTVMNAPRLLTPEVRQGFSYAFPYEDVVNAVYKELIQRSGPIPDNVKGFDPDVFIYETDLGKAKDLILSGGFQEGDTFEYMFDSTLAYEQTIAELFQANVAAMGFNLELIPVDIATLNSVAFGDAPPEDRPHFVASWGWWPDYNDPWNQLAPNFMEEQIGDGGSNVGGYANARFEEIMAEAEHYESEEQLAELMKEAQNILTELDPPAIYLGQVIRYTVLGDDIEGFVPNPLYLDSFNFYDMSRATS
ncbi:MAG: ABC transporter substrate-binding protein, partial [Thermomicrobiales bacterium]|nr:ABC transporter substrate-binding protein [Thermomicrobiales bacterium]